MKKHKENSAHWSRQKEVSGYRTIKFTLILFKYFPMIILRCLAFPVGFFYFIFSKNARKESKRFLFNVSEFIEDPRLVKKCRSSFGPLRHIISFALALLEKIQSWGGKFKLKAVNYQNDDIGELIGELESGKGIFMIFSHLGNAEALRGLLNLGQTGVTRKVPFTAIMNLKVSANFTNMLNELNPQSTMDIISVEEIGPATAVLLEERLAVGGVVLVAGDRTSPIGSGNNIKLPFLGKDASFSSGIFYMASIMNAPVYFIFGLRKKDLSLKTEYNMHVHKSGISFKTEDKRKERAEKSVLLAKSFVDLTETYCKKHPFQWYNFFNFWQEEDKI